MSIKELIEKSDLNISKEKILYNEPMKKYTTFKVGGPAECLIKIENINELKEILKFTNENNIKLTVLGNGSNVLILDKGISGITLIIKMENTEFEETEENLNNKIGDYPIITVEEAKNRLLEQRYWTSATYPPNQDNISKIELIYKTSNYHKYFAPYYCFWVSNGEKMQNGLEIYSAFYISAIEEKYLK